MIARATSPRGTKGFTLMELVVAIAVIGILAAIGIPSYLAQVQKGRRVDAKSAVLDLAGREERYYASNNAYTNNAAQMGYTAFPQAVGGGYYTVTVTVNQASTTFVASATVAAGSPQANDAQCQYFSVDNTGVQFSSASDATGADTSSTCWH